MNPAYPFKSIAVFPHHIKQDICGTRAKYRDGRKDAAVKVYTVNQESMYLLICNVPAIGGAEELRALCDQYGVVEDFRPLDDYPCEEFTEVYLVKYSLFPPARTAKKHLDDKSFLGSTLHVCYAPEFETVHETKLKLQERRKYVAWKTNTGKKASGTSSVMQLNKPTYSSNTVQKSSFHHQPTPQPVTYIWAGKEYTVQPESSTSATEPLLAKDHKPSKGLFVPRQLKSKSSPLPESARTNNSLRSEMYNPIPLVNDASYQSTISTVREKVSRVSVPNVRVSSKRRKRV